MEETRYQPDPKQPFGLHDCRIDEIRISNNNLILNVKDEFVKLSPADQPAPFVRGSILVEGIDPDFCEITIQGRGGRAGGFRGEKLSLAEFAEKYKGFNFEVVYEYYGWHRLQYTGWLWMPDAHPKDMTLTLEYFTGDMVYRTEESKDDHAQRIEISY